MSTYSKYLVCIPTYNEALNIAEVVERTLALNIEGLQILVVDDNSPDGTQEIVEQIIKKDASKKQPRVHLLARSKKEGLGPAYLAAFKWGLERGYAFIVEMDADGSHQPEELPRLITAASSADLVLGTRWIPGGRVINWPIHRKAISRLGTWYAEIALRLPYKDLTGGFRLYNCGVLKKIDLRSIKTRGYGFQIEMALRAVEVGAKVAEVPITFIERTQGRSKMSRAIVVEALVHTTKLGITRYMKRR